MAWYSKNTSAPPNKASSATICLVSEPMPGRITDGATIRIITRKARTAAAIAREAQVRAQPSVEVTAVSRSLARSASIHAVPLATIPPNSAPIPVNTFWLCVSSPSFVAI
jgi:hypothetical protein